MRIIPFLSLVCLFSLLSACPGQNPDASLSLQIIGSNFLISEKPTSFDVKNAKEPLEWSLVLDSQNVASDLKSSGNSALVTVRANDFSCGKPTLATLLVKDSKGGRGEVKLPVNSRWCTYPSANFYTDTNSSLVFDNAEQLWEANPGFRGIWAYSIEQKDWFPFQSNNSLFPSVNISTLGSNSLTNELFAFYIDESGDEIIENFDFTTSLPTSKSFFKTNKAAVQKFIANDSISYALGYRLDAPYLALKKNNGWVELALPSAKGIIDIATLNGLTIVITEQNDNLISLFSKKTSLLEDNKTDTWQPVNIDASVGNPQFITAFSGYFWLGTSKGLLRGADGSNWSLISPQNSLQALTNKNSLLVQTGASFQIYDAASKKTEEYSYKSVEEISALSFSPLGNIAIKDSYNNLYLLSKETLSWVRIVEPQGPSQILSLAAFKSVPQVAAADQKYGTIFSFGENSWNAKYNLINGHQFLDGTVPSLSISNNDTLWTLSSNNSGKSANLTAFQPLFQQPAALTLQVEPLQMLPIGNAIALTTETSDISLFSLSDKIQETPLSHTKEAAYVFSNFQQQLCTLSNDVVQAHCYQVDNKGNLTLSSSLSLSSTVKQYISSQAKFGFSFDQKNQIWVAATDTLGIMDPSSGNISPQDCAGAPPLDLSAMVEFTNDEKGNIWYAQGDHIRFYNTTAPSCTVLQHTSHLPWGIPDETITHFAVGSGAAWIYGVDADEQQYLTQYFYE